MTQRGRAGARPGSARRPSSPRRESADATRPPAAARVDLAAVRSRLRAVIEPVVSAAGYDIEELTLSRAGRRYVVRVMVDSDAGVQLDDVAVLSRSVSAALDEAEERAGELLNGEYQLEVSSPGVDRPLTLPRHWRRKVGRLVTVTAAGRPVTGRVLRAGDDGVLLEIDGAEREFSHADLGPGRVQIEFNRLAEAELDDSDELDDGDDAAAVDENDDDEDGEGEE